MTAHELTESIVYCFRSHAEQPEKPSKAVRKWDGRTPYGIHPTWCAMTLLAETNLPESFREAGAQALLFHDILEDTTAELPEGTPDEVIRLVKEMTFASSDEEMQQIWSKPIEVKLLKLYDKTSNLLDGSWMSIEKRDRYGIYLLDLCAEVERHYGEFKLNIVDIARAVVTADTIRDSRILTGRNA